MTYSFTDIRSFFRHKLPIKILTPELNVADKINGTYRTIAQIFFQFKEKSNLVLDSKLLWRKAGEEKKKEIDFTFVHENGRDIRDYVTIH